MFPSTCSQQFFLLQSNFWRHFNIFSRASFQFFFKERPAINPKSPNTCIYFMICSHKNNNFSRSYNINFHRTYVYIYVTICSHQFYFFRFSLSIFTLFHQSAKKKTGNQAFQRPSAPSLLINSSCSGSTGPFQPLVHQSELQAMAEALGFHQKLKTRNVPSITWVGIIAMWVWINTYENTIFRGMNMNIHECQLFWCELQGYKVLTHCHVWK